MGVVSSIRHKRWVLLGITLLVALTVSTAPCLAQNTALEPLRSSNVERYHKPPPKKPRKSFFSSRAERARREAREARSASSLMRSQVGGTALDKALSKTVAEDPSPVSPGSKTVASNKKAGDEGNPGSNIPPGKVNGGPKPSPGSEPGIIPPETPNIPNTCLEILGMIKQLMEKLQESKEPQDPQSQEPQTQEPPAQEPQEPAT